MKTGFELEFTAAINDAENPQLGRFQNYVYKLMEESNIFGWRLDEDASCGNELVSPPLEEDKGLAQVIQVCHCVKSAKERYRLSRVIGPDAGVHYHFDATDLVKQSHKNVVGIRNALILAALLEPLWYSMNPGARFDTGFAAPLNFNLFMMVRARDMTDIRDIWFRPYMGVVSHSDSYRVKNNSYLPSFINNDKANPEKYDYTRYHGFNLVALFKHGTFEYRYTHGSFEPNNVELWFNLYRQVVEAARTVRTNDIIKMCPVNISSIKLNGMEGIHQTFYSDLRSTIKFLFKIIPQDVRMLKFILTKLIKYSPEAMPPEVVLRIFDYQGEFAGLMELIESTTISSSHYSRNRNQFMEAFAEEPLNDRWDDDAEEPNDEDY